MERTEPSTKLSLALGRMSRRVFVERIAKVASAPLAALPTGSPTPRDCSVLAGSRIRLIVPHPPGGGYDRFGRLVAPLLGQQLAARVVVDNVAGAGGTVGANVLKTAPVDGKTIGILNSSGMLMASLLGGAPFPDPRTDFALLGRIAPTPQIWASRASSALENLDHVRAIARKRPVLFALQDIASTNFAGIVTSTHLLGIEADFVSGYQGTRAMVLALLRDEVDLISISFDSLRGFIDSGEVNPILQITPQRISPHDSLDGVPILPDASGPDPDDLQAPLLGLMELGRVLAAPAGIPAHLRECLEQNLFETLNTPRFLQAAAAAGMVVAPRSGAATREAMGRTADDALRLIPLIRVARRRAHE